MSTSYNLPPSVPASYDVDPMPEQSVDPGLYRAVVYFLGAVAVLTVVGTLALSFVGIAAPDGVIAIGGMAVGAFAALVKPRSG